MLILNTFLLKPLEPPRKRFEVVPDWQGRLGHYFRCREGREGLRLSTWAGYENAAGDGVGLGLHLRYVLKGAHVSQVGCGVVEDAGESGAGSGLAHQQALLLGVATERFRWLPWLTARSADRWARLCS